MTSVCAFDTLPLRIITLHAPEYDTVKTAFQDTGFVNPVSRFTAVNGKERQAQLKDDGVLSIRALCEIEKMKTREAHSSLPSWGGVGCYLSHETLWHEATASQHGIIIAEADAFPLPDAMAGATAAFDELVLRLGGLPDVLHIGYFFSVDAQPYKGVTTCTRTMNRILGLQCYYISPRGAKMLLKRSRPIEIQVDSYMGYCYSLNIDTLKAFQTVRSFVIQKSLTGTTIQTKRVEDLAGGLNGTGDAFNTSIAFLVGCLFILLVLHFNTNK